MESEFWLRDKNGSSFREIRYKLTDWYEKLWCADKREELLVGIAKYYKNNSGEWERVHDGSCYCYVTLPSLLTNFIAVDGPFDRELNNLTEQVASFWKENLDNQLKVTNGIYSVENSIKPEDIGVEVVPEEEERNINDGK